MKSTAQAIALWILLLVTAVLLYNVFTVRPNSKETTFSFSRFMDEVNNKNVKDVKVVDSDVTGELVSGGTFRTVVPVGYATLYDKLQGMNVTIEHPIRNPWLAALISWAPILFLAGLWIFFMRQRQSAAQRKKANAEQNLPQTTLVQLEPDVAKAFSNAQAVNEALRLVIQLKEIRGTT